VTDMMRNLLPVRHTDAVGLYAGCYRGQLDSRIEDRGLKRQGRKSFYECPQSPSRSILDPRSSILDPRSSILKSSRAGEFTQ
jgi:hypothetical protein